MWLCSSGLKGETEILIIAAQDEALSTRYHQRNIKKQPTDSTCRMCCTTGEHIKHIVVGSTTLALSEYTNRHNKVAGYIHWMICKHMGLQVTDKQAYSEHIPERVVNINGTASMWDIPVIIGQITLANRPDTVLHEEKEKTCLLIDISIPDCSSVNTKETEKLINYKD